MARRVAVSSAAALGICFGVLLGAGAAARAQPPPTAWELPNLNRASTRALPQSPITTQSVRRLRLVWSFRFENDAVSDPSRSPEDLRGVVSTPIVGGGMVFVQDARSNVYALDRRTGAVRWVHRFAAVNLGRNGLALDSGRLYGTTDSTAFALSAETGRLIWQRFLISPTGQYVDVAPLVANGLVYVSTVGYPPGGRGAIDALDAHDGAIRWVFSTIRRPWAEPSQAGGGGVWYTPSLSLDDVLYAGVANSYPLGGSTSLPNGGAYAGADLYTDSLIALDARTGHLLWYDQVSPHDVRDYDFQLPPVLATLGAGRSARKVVFGAGKAGEVIAWGVAAHRRLWVTPVGQHRNDRGPLPPKPVTICPGVYGGVETPMAYEKGRLFVPVVDLCARGSAHGYEPLSDIDPVDGRGAFVALDATNGRVLWRRAFPQPDFGCASAAAGVIFTSTFDGRMYALDAKNGATLWVRRAPGGINGCPALSGTMLIVPAGSGTSRMPDPRFELLAYATS